MKQYDKKKPLISLHIPKCAGTSFRLALKKWFKKKVYFHYFDEENNKMPKKYRLTTGFFKQKLSKGVCIHGHFNVTRKIGVMDYYPEVDQFITILRDPFEIALSNYFYGKQIGDNRYKEGKVLLTREEFKNIRHYFNMRKSYLLSFMPEEMTMSNYSEILEKYFVYLGVAEDLQTSVNMLAEKLGFSPIKIGRVNISKRDEEVPWSIREEFMHNHPLEYKIYEYAIKHYKD